MMLSRLRPLVAQSFRRHRFYSSPVVEDLKSQFTAELSKKQALLSELKSTPAYADKSRSYTVSQTILGAKGIWGLVCETSSLDPLEGIRFRGYSIPELQEKLPRAPNGGTEPLPEGLFWLMLTGQLPTADQVSALSKEFYDRLKTIPKHLDVALDALPKDLHPMTQLSIGIMALQYSSEFSAAYARKVSKKEHWPFILEDALNLISRITYIAAKIYRRSYYDGVVNAPKSDFDWSANLAHMMNFKDTNFTFDLFRLYLTIHTDHEGGNVSAHTTHLVGSALSDPYYAVSAGMNGLAGPLHGLANQEVLKFVRTLQQSVENEGKKVADMSSEELRVSFKKATWDVLNSGNVVPGYGHAVLRRTDPRYHCQHEFAEKHTPNDPTFKVVSTLYQIVPDILTKHGKTLNPWPNVDAHSGQLLQAYDLKEEDFYTVMFGVSRTLGVLASLVWDRGLGLGIERPKSVTLEALHEFATS